MPCNAKLKRRFGQTGGHDQRQVSEASRSYKMKHSKMADLSVVASSFYFTILTLFLLFSNHLPKYSISTKDFIAMS